MPKDLASKKPVTPSSSRPTHTPGPWRVEPAVPGEASGVHVFAANPNGCAADGDIVTIADFIENDANARLIAAAPELLAALKRIEDDDTGGCRCEHDDENCCALATDYCCPFCIAAVAIAKAEGR